MNSKCPFCGCVAPDDQWDCVGADDYKSFCPRCHHECRPPETDEPETPDLFLPRELMDLEQGKLFT